MFVYVSRCVYVLVFSRIYTGGSPVWHWAVLGSLRTWRRIDIGIFCLVSAPVSLFMPCCWSHHSRVLPHPSIPPTTHLRAAFLTLICKFLLWLLMKFNWLSLGSADSSVVTLSHCCPPLLSDDTTRVVLQGKEDYINASHITVNITDMKLCLVHRLYIKNWNSHFQVLFLIQNCVCTLVDFMDAEATVQYFAKPLISLDFAREMGCSDLLKHVKHTWKYSM